MAKYEDPIVKCPFYSWEEGKKLCCEGVNACSSVQVTFTTKEQRRAYERMRCKRSWKDCPLAQALEKKVGLKSMKRKADIAIGERFVSELHRVMPQASDRNLARLLGCSKAMIQEWREGRTPGGMYLARILQLGGDVEYILTGRRKPKENQPEFLAELEEEYT